MLSVTVVDRPNVIPAVTMAAVEVGSVSFAVKFGGDPWQLLQLVL